MRLDPSIRFQNVEGWGGRVDASEFDNPEATKEIVHDLGLNRFGIALVPDEIVGVSAEQAVPEFSSWRADKLDSTIQQAVLPLQREVASRNEKFVLYLTMPWPRLASLSRDPDSYVRFALAVLERFRHFGVDVDYWVMVNEPEKNKPWTPAQLGVLVARLVRAIRAAGFRTRIAAPEAVQPDNVGKWLAAIANTPGAGQYLGQLTFHSYDYDPTLSEHPPATPRVAIANLARQLGINVAQTEQGAAGKRHQDHWDGERTDGGLYFAETMWADLTFANASAWELHRVFTHSQYGTRWIGSGFVHLKSDGFLKPVHYWTLRQFTRFVRPGAVRVAARVEGRCEGLRAVAFLSTDNRPVVVLVNLDETSCATRVGPLPEAMYKTVTTGAGKRGQEETVGRVERNQDVSLNVPARSVVTLLASE